MKSMRDIRLDEMENMILREGALTLKELSKTFGISLNTVRIDIDTILQRGRIRKIYGGVRANNTEHGLIDYRSREDSSLHLKKEIGKKAASLVNDGDIIFIDSGTTTVHMIEFLKDKNNIKVVTNNIVAISRLLGNDKISVIGIGGVVRNKTMSFASAESLKVLKAYNIQKAFMAATAVNIKNGVMNSSFDERAVKMLAIERSEEIYLLADSTKFDKNALLTYCSCEDLTGIVTDSENPKYVKLLVEHGVTII